MSHIKGLIINEPCISLVLNGQKIWEMRKTQTSIRGPIALIRKGSGLIVGVVDIVDCLPTLDESEYARHENSHHIPPSRQLRARLDGWSVPWVFTNVRQLLQPVPYRHPNGAVIWVNLQPAIADTISRQLGANAPSDWQEGPEAAQTPSCQPMDTASQSMRREEPKTTVISHPKPEPKTSPPPHASRPPERPSTTIFVFRPELAQAYGRPHRDGGFVVSAGSTAMRHGSPAVKRDLAERDSLVRNGILVPDSNPALFRFSRNHVFRSSSCAAGVIRDGNASGPSLWKDERTGKTLKDYEAA
ncbi:DUF4357 domain-containing protein [Mesorhizobium sp. M2A.F.Ca.ET.039.01.1.1]|uniref:ASCH domain-containing protein n=1 Tax=Mesorhizobium sp. M2A.F.Ca.ET.039.01.1.1 TaxID=2496746 RepID=UPI001AED08B2|nr:DUF4357 domain-containing protein [Mesorhizobium sp. M2A.F.Ca.ET.039.01.1.1]